MGMRRLLLLQQRRQDPLAALCDSEHAVKKFVAGAWARPGRWCAGAQTGVRAGPTMRQRYPHCFQRQIDNGTDCMDIHTHRAPIAYRTGKGRKQNIPIGPCLIESLGQPSVDVVWGEDGERSAALPMAEVEAAQQQGHLVLLD
jgi:hypothetical protein